VHSYHIDIHYIFIHTLKNTVKIQCFLHYPIFPRFRHGEFFSTLRILNAKDEAKRSQSARRASENQTSSTVDDAITPCEKQHLNEPIYTSLKMAGLPTRIVSTL